MASGVFVVDSKGKMLIGRNYRGDVGFGTVEKFVSKLLEMEDSDIKPIMQWEDNITFLHVKWNELFFVAATRGNTNVSALLLFLYKLIKVFEEYFEEVDEESIRDNFVIIYELLDEVMDFGYPQYTEAKIMKDWILQEGNKADRAFGQEETKDSKAPPTAVTHAVSWRNAGVKYRKNEVFLDIIETVNLLVNSNGTVIRSEVVGAIKMRCYLSGMPELRLGLNDKLLFEAHGKSVSKGKAVELEDVRFHQCVRLSKFENDRTISFVPPDGEFDLMNYRLSTNVKPLIWIESVVEHHSHSRVEYLIKAKSQFKQRSTANNVEVIVPVPPDADTPKFKTSTGTVTYAPELDACVWKMKTLPGNKEVLMRAHFGLPSTQDEEERQQRPPIQVKFEIPYFTVSGLQVRYLKIIEKSGYQALPWVRYITVNGDYSVRMPQT